MLYQKKGDTVLDSGKVFTVGGEVFANHACDCLLYTSDAADE